MNQSYPTVYETDMREMERDMGKIAAVWEEVNEEEVEETKKLWVKTFDQPYELAGGEANGGAAKVKPLVHWEVADDDVNVRYKSMLPRFLLEVGWKFWQFSALLIFVCLKRDTRKGNYLPNTLACSLIDLSWHLFFL